MNIEIQQFPKMPPRKKWVKKKKKKGKKVKKLESDDLMKEVKEQEKQLEWEVERSRDKELKKKLDKFFLLE